MRSLIQERAVQLALADGYESWASVDGYAQETYLEQARREATDEQEDDG